MAEAEQDRPESDGLALAQIPVGQRAADNGHDVNKRRVGAVHDG